MTYSRSGETPEQRRQREWQEQLARDAAARKKREKADADAKAAAKKKAEDERRRLARNPNYNPLANPQNLVGPLYRPPEPPKPLDPAAQFLGWLDHGLLGRPKPGERPPHPNSGSSNLILDPQQYLAQRAQVQLQRSYAFQRFGIQPPKPLIGPPAPTNDGKPQPNRTLIAANPNVLSDVGQNLIAPPQSPAPTTAPPGEVTPPPLLWQIPP